MSVPDEEAIRFAPPRARVAEPPPAEGLVLGTRWNRLGAVLIDLVIGLVAIYVTTRLLPPTILKLFITPLGGWVDLQFLGSALFLLLHGWLLLRHGQTIGKHVVGLRIVRPDGRPVGPLRLLGLRYGSGFLLMLIPMIGPLCVLIDALLIFGPQRRCLHDRIAGTIVVQT